VLYDIDIVPAAVYAEDQLLINAAQYVLNATAADPPKVPFVLALITRSVAKFTLVPGLVMLPADNA